MTIHLRDVINKSDWVKIGILLVVAAGCWTWVYREYQKPIIPLDLTDNFDVRAPR